MFEKLKPVTVFILFFTIILVAAEALILHYDIDNYRLSKTAMDVHIYNFYSDENPTLVIRGNKKMSWGEYAISFELYDKTNVSLKKKDGTHHRKWLVESFHSDDSRVRYYEILNCPKGKHVMTIQIRKGTFSKTYYLPFEVIG